MIFLETVDLSPLQATEMINLELYRSQIPYRVKWINQKCTVDCINSNDLTPGIEAIALIQAIVNIKSHLHVDPFDRLLCFHFPVLEFIDERGVTHRIESGFSIH